jgi:hypothetical protein
MELLLYDFLIIRAFITNFKKAQFLRNKFVYLHVNYNYMDTKLTLNLDKTVIEQSKEYAKSHKISLSRLIESYLSSLILKKNKDFEITPLVKSLSGVIDINKDFNYKEKYTDYLNEKYK